MGINGAPSGIDRRSLVKNLFVGAAVASVPGLSDIASAEDLKKKKEFSDPKSNTKVFLTSEVETFLAKFGLTIYGGSPIILNHTSGHSVKFGQSLLLANKVEDSERGKYEKEYRFHFEKGVLYLCLLENTSKGQVAKVGIVVQPSNENGLSFVSSYLQKLKIDGEPDIIAKGKVMEIVSSCFPDLTFK